jgi:hypothetical protein
MLSYYNDKGEIVDQYETKEGEYSYPDFVAKGNSHSMFIWTKNRHLETIVLWVYDLKEPSNNRTPRRLEIKNTFAFVPSLVHCSLVNVWECRPDCFMLACNSNMERKDANTANNVNFVYDARANICREAKFSLQKEENECLLERTNLGDYSIFPVFEYKKGVALPSPIYFVNNETEEIYAQTTWQCQS